MHTILISLFYLRDTSDSWKLHRETIIRRLRFVRKLFSTKVLEMKVTKRKLSELRYNSMPLFTLTKYIENWRPTTTESIHTENSWEWVAHHRTKVCPCVGEGSHRDKHKTSTSLECTCILHLTTTWKIAHLRPFCNELTTWRSPWAAKHPQKCTKLSAMVIGEYFTSPKFSHVKFSC